MRKRQGLHKPEERESSVAEEYGGGHALALSKAPGWCEGENVRGRSGRGSGRDHLARRSEVQMGEKRSVEWEWGVEEARLCGRVEASRWFG